MPQPKAVIPLQTLENLAMIHCTIEEAAAVLGYCRRTLDRALTKKEYREVWERGQHKGKASLRRLQWKAAQGGNTSMLIWLGKQMLGQRDTPKEEAGTALPVLEIKVVRE